MQIVKQSLQAPADKTKGGAKVAASDTAPAPVTSVLTPAVEAATPAPASAKGPSPAMLALFQAPAESLPDLTKAERLTLPTMYKPNDIPVGGVIQGKIIKFVKSPVTTVKGTLVWLRHPSGVEFTFPVTGVIRSALASGIEADDKAKLLEQLATHVGKTLVAKRLDNKLSVKYNKDTFMFDVYLIPVETVIK